MNRFRHMHFASPIKTVLIALVSLPLSAALIATASSLETDSPFLPSGYSNKKPAPVRPTPATNGPLAKQLEFRGVVQMNDTYEFSLFNKKENRGYWIPENGNVSGVSVRNFKLDSMTITVSHNGRTELLTLMSATDSPLPVVDQLLQSQRNLQLFRSLTPIQLKRKTPAGGNPLPVSWL